MMKTLYLFSTKSGALAKMRKSLLIISLLLTLTIVFLPLSVIPVRADTVFYQWDLSNATNGENTNCNNYWDNIASTSSSGNFFEHDGIRATDNSWTGKTLSSVTLYVMRLSGFSGSGTVTLASYSSTDGHEIAILGTIAYASLPVCVSSPPVSTTFSGLNYVIPSGAYIGLSYSGAAEDSVWNFFDYNAGNVALPNVFEYLFQCTAPSNCTFNDFSGAHSPFFGSMSETPAAPPSHSALYTTWAPIVAIMVVGMALFGLVKSKGAPLIVLVISLAVILGFVSVIMGVWS